MPERGAYVMKRQGCLIESRLRTQLDFRRTGPKVRKANRNPESAFCSSLLLSAKPFYSSFLLSSFLCCSVGGEWLPMTLSFVAKFQPLENVSCHLNSKFPKTLVGLHSRCLSPIQSAMAMERGYAEQACLPLLIPEAEMGR